MSTSLTVNAARAKIVHDEIAAHREQLERVEDARSLQRFAGWEPRILAAAVAELVARGAIAEDTSGRLIVRGWHGEPAAPSSSLNALVLARLRRAGRHGVAYVLLRDSIGDSPEPVLDALRADGHQIQRTPSSDGVLAVLVEPTRRAA